MFNIWKRSLPRNVIRWCQPCIGRKSRWYLFNVRRGQRTKRSELITPGAAKLTATKDRISSWKKDWFQHWMSAPPCPHWETSPDANSEEAGARYQIRLLFGHPKKPSSHARFNEKENLWQNSGRTSSSSIPSTAPSLQHPHHQFSTSLAYLNQACIPLKGHTSKFHLHWQRNIVTSPAPMPLHLHLRNPHFQPPMHPSFILWIWTLRTPSSNGCLKNSKMIPPGATTPSAK